MLGEHGDAARGDNPAERPGEPDGFERLWTPHRMAYVLGESRPAAGKEESECPFCRIPGESDEDGLIVARGEHCFVVMNLFPYNSGHVLVCPYRHVAGYVDATVEETTEMAAMTQRMIRAFNAAMRPAGFNLGINQGNVAGAGIAAHLHQHIVPRWGGDANFLPVIARTKALPELLADTRAKLADAWLAVA